MKTRFSAAQLADPDIADADRVIRACVRHGFCPQTCPTYVLLGDENDSPRGRIDLIREMLEDGGAPTAKAVQHLDRCLSCLSCETICAARVEYRRLIDRARVHIERHFRRAYPERMLRALLATVLPRPRLLRGALAAGRLARPFARHLPGRLAAVAELVPGAPPAVARIARLHAAEGERRARVGLLAGCVQRVLGGDINAATIRLLTRQGCEVAVPAGRQCCGALDLHLGRAAHADRHARRTIRAFEREIARGALDAIVVNASGCGTVIKDYAHQLAGDPAWSERAAAVAGLATDVSEVLDRLGLRGPGRVPALPIAYHDACSLQHGQRVTAPPRRLLRQAGFDVRDVPERHFCCGSAGTYNLLQPALAGRLGARKARAAEATGAAAVAAGNLGCLLQIGRHTPLPVLHTAALLDWATGGPVPAALAGIDLSRWPARAAADSSAPPAAAEAINFWTYGAG